MPSRPISLALLGATGLVGRIVLDVLADSDLDLAEVRLLASPRSAGTRLELDGEELVVAAPGEGSFRGVDVAIFCVPADVARAWAPRAWAEGCAVVDGSPAFRADPEVPLVVPEVNAAAIAAYRAKGVVALPAGSVAALAATLAPLHAAAGITRVGVTTLEPVASGGHRAVEQLEREATDLMNGREPEPGGGVPPHRIAFNVVPQVGPFTADGRTEEEVAIAAELRRVLGLPELGVTATAVRVPVFYGLTAAANVATERPLPAEEARGLLRQAPGVKVVDAPGEGIYPMPMLTLNDDAVLVGRIRDDGSLPHGLDLVLSTDDLRKGMAANAVRVAEEIAQGLTEG
jgi:aspartate-semialdehyde dehydrogenase